MQIPASLEQEIGDAVASNLERELARRCLVLAADEVAAAEVEAERVGARLLVAVVDQCYSFVGHGGSPAFAFDSDQTATRLQAALAFGAITGRVLSPTRARGIALREPIELLSAVFNVGIGLIDSVCDEDPVVGRRLLELVAEPDLATAAERELPRRWLRARFPACLERDATIAFTVDIIECFFATLHAAYPGKTGLDLRREIGTHLAAALQAERVSAAGLKSSYTRDRLRECSRLTSVLPFEIIETLVGAGDRRRLPTPGASLGEAMWQIDDLVDLCEDAGRGALNSLLISGAPGVWDPSDERTMVGVLERLLASSDIAEAAGRAAENLQLGLERAGGRRPGKDRPPATPDFLRFIQDYAGIPPRAGS
jgi:hypothetical protein